MRADPFQELLNAFWLRPETALWRALDIQAMSGFRFESPSLDLGCGDGLFSFIRAGGRLRPSFDAFQSIGSLDRFFKNADVFDAAPTLRAQVLMKPGYRIDVGFDHKANLLAKAAGLGLYRSLREGDANKNLPFAGGSFKTAFSNIIYWLDDPGHALSELERVLTPGGRACVMLPNASLPRFSFYQRFYAATGDARFKFLAKLDRGRLSDNIKQAKTARQWRRVIAGSGLTVAHHRRHLSKTVVQMWDIGLRPLFPALYKMAFGLGATRRAEVKREWISVFDTFLRPFLSLDGQLDRGEEPAFHCFVLQKPR